MFCRQPIYLLPNRGSRRAVTLLEVLISMFVLTIGLLSVAALIPVGKSEMTKALVEDTKAVLGQTACQDFKARGMADIRNWRTRTGAEVTPPSEPKAWAIDPLMIAAQPTDYFPHNGTTFMDRITLVGPTVNSILPLEAAEAMFTARDDLLFDLPTNADQRPIATPNAPVASPGISPPADRRMNEGQFSWMATLVPADGENGDQYTLSIVIFHRRGAGANALLANRNRERQISVVFNGNGWGGGEATISSAMGFDGITTGSWILVTGTEQYFKEGQTAAPASTRQQFKWYRIAAMEEVGASTTTRRVTLVGPDWNYGNNASGAAFEGIVGVYEKVIRIERPSLWSAN